MKMGACGVSRLAELWSLERPSVVAIVRCGKQPGGPAPGLLWKSVLDMYKVHSPSFKQSPHHPRSITPDVGVTQLPPAMIRETGCKELDSVKYL